MIPRYRFRRRRYWSFKQELGSKLYYIILLLLLVGAYKIWGLSVFDEFWLAILGIVSYKLVGFVLRATGIWRPPRNIR
ncbi:MAG: hypothetical protein WCG83_02175 [Candidatus Peregrinibacteria bacterium]